MNDKQKAALKRLCERFESEFKEQDFHPSLGSPDGWFEGWVGNRIYVGCSPEGEIHS